MSKEAQIEYRGHMFEQRQKRENKRGWGEGGGEEADVERDIWYRYIGEERERRRRDRKCVTRLQNMFICSKKTCFHACRHGPCLFAHACHATKCPAKNNDNVLPRKQKQTIEQCPVLGEGTVCLSVSMPVCPPPCLSHRRREYRAFVPVCPTPPPSIGDIEWW